MIDLEAHKKAEEEATPGPWVPYEGSKGRPTINHGELRLRLGEASSFDDADLICLMRNDHAEMIREIEHRMRLSEALEQRFSAVCDAIGVSADLWRLVSADELYDDVCERMRTLVKGAVIAETEMLTQSRETLRKELEHRDREATEMSNAYSAILTESEARRRELEGHRLVARNGLSSLVNGFSCSFCGARDVTLTVGPEVAICETCAAVAARSEIRELRAKLFDEREVHHIIMTKYSSGDGQDWNERKAIEARDAATKIRKGEM